MPDDDDELKIYFLRIHNNASRISLKCCMTSSISIMEIKRRIHPRLEEALYFLFPTLLKVICTSKIGWLYLAHPDLTPRTEIITCLDPHIKDHTSRKIEFQAIPEMELIEHNNISLKHRVIALQGPHDKQDTRGEFFTTAFSEDSPINIGYLSRYTFIPSHSIGD